MVDGHLLVILWLGYFLIPQCEGSAAWRHGSHRRRVPRSVTANNGQPLYTVTTLTGNGIGADTKSNVFLQMFGENGQTNQKALNNGDLQRFAVGKSSSFNVKAKDIGKLTKIKLSKDTKGGMLSESWFLQKITIVDGKGIEYTFPCDCWIEDKNNQLSKDLTPSDVNEPTTPGDTPCIPNPCLNQGICSVKPAQPSGFRCQCKPGFSGDKCQDKAGEPTPSTTPATPSSSSSSISSTPTSPSQATSSSTSAGSQPFNPCEGAALSSAGSKPTSPNQGACAESMSSAYVGNKPTSPTLSGASTTQAIATGGTGGTIKPVTPSPLPGPVGFQKALLRQINKQRLLHAAGPLLLDKSISQAAQQWAQKIANDGREGIDSETPYGVTVCSRVDPIENKNLAQKCVGQWYKTVKDYDWSDPTIALKASHFIQLVWKATTRVGIGKARSSAGKFFVVAYFSPASTAEETVKQNVSPATDLIAPTEQGKCPAGFKLFSRSCFAYQGIPLTWDNAIAQCAHKGAALASIQSREETSFVNSILTGSGEAWIGFHDRLMESRYTWVDGSLVNFHGFLPTEPTGPGENCVAIQNSAAGSGWADRKCRDQLPSVCRVPVQGPVTYKLTVEIKPEAKQTIANARSVVAPSGQNFVELIKKLLNKNISRDQKPVEFVGEQTASNPDGSSSVSVYMKMDPTINPNVGQSLQTYLDNNNNHLAPQSKNNATVASVTILNAAEGVCYSQCFTTCSNQCNPVCCSASFVLNGSPGTAPAPVPAAAPAAYPVPAAYPASYSFFPSQSPNQQSFSYTLRYPPLYPGQDYRQYRMKAAVPPPQPPPQPYPYPQPYPNPQPSTYGQGYGLASWNPYLAPSVDGCVRTCTKIKKMFCPDYCPRRCCRP